MDGNLAECFNVAPRAQALAVLPLIVGQDDPSLRAAQRLERYASIGRMFFQRFRRQGGLDDVQDAISAQRKAVELTQPSDINFGTRYTNLGAYLLARMQLTKSPNDIQDGISTLVHALSTIDTDDETDYFPLLHNLAASYMTSFQVSGDPEDLDACISNRQLCIQLTPPRHERLPFWMDVLGTALARRFGMTKNQSDIDEAITTFEAALSSTPFGHHFTSHLLYNLSLAFADRAFHYGRTSPLAASDHDKAISYRQRAVQVGRGRLDTEELASWIDSIAVLLGKRFESRKEESDIEAAIAASQEAVESLSSLNPSHPKLVSMHSNLASSFYARFRSAGHLTDLEDAINTQKKSVELCSSPLDTQAILGLLRLGIWFGERGEKFGEIGDFDKAIYYHKRGMAGTPLGHDDHAGHLSQLGNLFLMRFNRTGAEKDIDSAVQAHREAVLAHDSAPSGNEPVSSLYTNLGNSLTRRFEYSGILTDIDEAIMYQKTSTGMDSDEVPERKASMFTNLGLSLTKRFERTGDIGDVDEAIRSCWKALELDSDGTSGRHESETVKIRVYRLNNLCVPLLRRFERLGHMQDIEEAILIQREVVGLTHDDDPSLSTHFNNLARFLAARYGRTNEIGNLYTAGNRMSSEARPLRPPPPCSRDLTADLLEVRCQVDAICVPPSTPNALAAVNDHPLRPRRERLCVAMPSPTTRVLMHSGFPHHHRHHRLAIGPSLSYPGTTTATRERLPTIMRQCPQLTLIRTPTIDEAGLPRVAPTTTNTTLPPHTPYHCVRRLPTSKTLTPTIIE